MPAAHHATRQLKLVLDSLRRGQPLVDPAALALPFIRHRYQNEHVHTAATVEADLRTALATLVQRRLDALRGDSSGTPHAHTAEDLAETLRRDFSTPDIDRQAIACLYYRYLLPRPWKVKEIGAVVSPHAVDSPRELNQRLEERMRLLSRVSRRIGKHLKPLAAALDASYRLLSPSEQIALARLAVFHGPFSLAAARTVCAPSGDAKVGYDVGDAAVDRDADTDADADADSLPSRTHRPPVPAIDGADVPRLIDALAGKSLLRVAEDDASGERRFALLDTLREYGGQRLRKLGSGEAFDCHRRHADHFADVAEALQSAITGLPHGAAIELADGHRDNFAAALRWCLAEPRAACLGLRLATALVPYWLARGGAIDGQLALTHLLQATETLPLAPGSRIRGQPAPLLRRSRPRRKPRLAPPTGRSPWRFSSARFIKAAGRAPPSSAPRWPTKPPATGTAGRLPSTTAAAWPVRGATAPRPGRTSRPAWSGSKQRAMRSASPRPPTASAR